MSHVIPISTQPVAHEAWGYARTVYRDPRYAGRQLFLRKGKCSNFQYHPVRDLVLVVVTGGLRVTFGEEDSLAHARQAYLSAGEAFHVTPGTRYRLEAGEHNTTLMEFGTGYDDKEVVVLPSGD